MKKSQDKPMADTSKVSGEREPMSAKKGEFGASISPMGINTNGEMSGVERSGPAYESSYKGDIGKGDGGPSDERAGTSGKGL
jgi:hypothetical protein